MSDGQVQRGAAEIYEEFFVPAIFHQWPAHIVRIARIRAGERVLDVACGTGILARTVAAHVGARGRTVGLDPNEGMLAVARRTAPNVEWRQGRAEALPFEAGEFDAVVSQFGLMFFSDRAKALREMGRVLSPGGRLCVAVWSSLDASPGYDALSRVIRRLFGDEVGNENDAPFALGDDKAFARTLDEAGLRNARVRRISGTVRFPSLAAWMTTEIKGWTLAQRIDDAQFERLLHAARSELATFVRPDGAVEFSISANVAEANP